MKRHLEGAVDAALGSRPMTALADRISASRLRILAYHGVNNVESFRFHMEYLRTRYHPVSSHEVLDWLETSRPLPRRAVWVTFDDGEPTVVTKALPILNELDIRPTLFVCPGVVDTDEPFWWEVVEAATRYGAVPPDVNDLPLPALLGALKTVPDYQRRDAVGRMRAELQRGGLLPHRPQITIEQLHRFIDGGGTVGNHTWDHPCLDTCAPDEQERQIRTAHEWITNSLGEAPRLFAYPNGNHGDAAFAALRKSSYAAGLLFDHQLARRDINVLQLSRLRVNDYACPSRFAAIVSGVHGLTVQLRLLKRLTQAT